MPKTSLLVLQMLAPGNLLSGEFIGNQLGISRMSVSKAIKGLSKQRLEIASVPGRGYRLQSPVQLLDKKIIRSALCENGSTGCQIEILQEIDSTSDYLLEQSDKRDINRHVCLAECQCNGRGRRQRGWYATAYRNIALSMGWDFNDGMAGLTGLGIAAGVSIVSTLHKAGYDREIGLKWPNDIVWNNRKLGGLLIDVRGETDGPCLVVLGLGLNLALSEEDQQTIDQPCVSLEQISNDKIDRNALVTGMIKTLAELFEAYPSSGFERFQQLWAGYDRLFGREVRVIKGGTSFSGVAMGIDETGALLLDEGKETFSKFLSGDVSLRLAQ